MQVRSVHLNPYVKVSLSGKSGDQGTASCFFKSLVIIPFLISASIPVFTQYGHHLSAVYTRLGAYSKNFVNPLSIKSNVAAIASIRSINGAIYGERRFLLSELNSYSLAFCVPVPRGGIAVSADYSGYKEYNETQIGLGYAKSLGKIDIGVRFNLYSLRITGYGSDALFNPELGAILHLGERLYAGLHMSNLTRSSLGNNIDEKLPSVVSAGIGYECSELVLVQAEIIKEENKAVNIHAGMQYHFAGKLFFRLGLYGETANFYFGTGIHRKAIRLDISCSYHSRLGLTPGLLLVFQKPSKE